MKVPALLRDRRFLYIAGAGVGFAFLAWLFGDEPQHVVGANGWLLIDDEKTVRLVRGVRYRGCVQVPFPVPTSLVVDKVAPKMAERGFAQIVVTRTKPDGWPEVDCDIFVEATWDRPDEDLERPGAVELAWREAPG